MGYTVRPQRETGRRLPFLLNSVDQLGREIDPCVHSVASEIGFRAVSYAEKLLGDPALALTLFEEAAASVSEATKGKRSAGAPPVRDLSAYLFRTFIRKVHRTHQRSFLIEEPLTPHTESHLAGSNGADMEAAVLLHQLLATCDRVARGIAYCRLEGLSWKEIGKKYGISAHAAEVRFSKAIEHARKTLGLRGRKG